MPGDEVTRILHRMKEGDPRAAEELYRAVYGTMHAMAQRAMQGQSDGHTLQPTALVNEVYIKLVGADGTQWEGRNHFLATVARAMRQILVDHAKSKGRAKRGGDVHGRPARRVPLNINDLAEEEDPSEMLALEDAFRRLETQMPDVARVAVLRVFGQLTPDQVAEITGLSPRKVDRLWAVARTMLLRWTQGE